MPVLDIDFKIVGNFMNTSYVILGLLALLAIFVIVIYNRLIALRQSRRNAFSDIDVQLRLRFDLVPNLVEIVKGYAGHEKEVFIKVTEARAHVKDAHTQEERVKSENDLSQALVNLFAVAENYPELKANENFKQLQLELSDIENKISAARRFFNSATAEYNTAVQQFPANIIANMTGFAVEPFFESTDVDRKTLETAQKVKF
jgi:LemA protein